VQTPPHLFTFNRTWKTDWKGSQESGDGYCRAALSWLSASEAAEEFAFQQWFGYLARPPLGVGERQWIWRLEQSSALWAPVDLFKVTAFWKPFLHQLPLKCLSEKYWLVCKQRGALPLGSWDRI
jgi:hypothetical protein